MPTEKELLALCLRWIEDSPNDAFDRAMLIDAVKAKLKPEREWVSLTKEEIEAADNATHFHESPDWNVRFARAVEAKLREKNHG